MSQAPEFADLRRRFDLRADLARGHIPGWQRTPLPTLLRHTTPRDERFLMKFLGRIDEKRAARMVQKHAKRFSSGGNLEETSCSHRILVVDLKNR